MDNFIKKLKNIVECSNALYSLFAIDNKRKVGIKIALTEPDIRSFINDAITYLCEKKFLKMQLGEYPIATPKDYVETIKNNDARISETLNALVEIPMNVEINVTNLSQYNTYMAIVDDHDSKFYFLTRKTPFIAYGKKNSLFAKIGLTKEYEVIANDTVRLVKHFDCIVVGDTCYMVTKDGRDLLGLQKLEVKKSKDKLNLLSEKCIVSSKDIEIIEKYMKKSGKQQCLAEVNLTLMEELSNIAHTNKDLISQKYQLNVYGDDSGKLYISASNENEIEKLISTLTNRRGKNFDGDVVSSKSPFIREHQ